jgi:hypothetical protein
MAVVAAVVILATRGLSDNAFVTLAQVVAVVGLLCAVSVAALAWRANR